MNSLTRRVFLLSAILSGMAAAQASISPGRAEIANPADQPLRELHSALEATMRAGQNTPFPQRFNALAPVVDQAFDLETVLKVSVGLLWDSMNPDTRLRLLTMYRRFTIATYVASFDRYEGERFLILPSQRDAGTDRIVGTEIISGGGQHMRLDYVMRNANGAWRAVDVLLEGSISRVAVQRSDFRKSWQAVMPMR